MKCRLFLMEQLLEAMDFHRLDICLPPVEGFMSGRNSSNSRDLEVELKLLEILLVIHWECFIMGPNVHFSECPGPEPFCWG